MLEAKLWSKSTQALGQTADWFKRALSVERVRGNLQLSGYSACGQDGGVQLPREYVEGIGFKFNVFLMKQHLLMLLISGRWWF